MMPILRLFRSFASLYLVLLVLLSCSPQRPIALECRFDSEGKPIPMTGKVLRELARPERWKPNEAEREMKEIYHVLKAIAAKSGRLPATIDEVNRASVDILGRSLSTADWQCDDQSAREGFSAAMPRNRNDYGVAWLGLRHNGQRKPAVPPIGARDVWLTCTLYLRNNSRRYPDCSTSMHLDGFAIVLWSDGAVERIPHGKILTARVNGNMFPMMFPGETGLPPNTKPLSEVLGRMYKVTADQDAVIGN